MELERLCARCGEPTAMETNNFTCTKYCNPRRTFHYKCCGEVPRQRNPFECNDCCLAIKPSDLGIPDPPTKANLPSGLHVVMGVDGRAVILKTTKSSSEEDSIDAEMLDLLSGTFEKSN